MSFLIGDSNLGLSGDARNAKCKMQNVKSMRNGIRNFKFGFIGEFLCGHPERRAKPEVEGSPYVTRDPSTPPCCGSAQDDRFKETVKQQFIDQSSYIVSHDYVRGMKHSQRFRKITPRYNRRLPLPEWQSRRTWSVPSPSARYLLPPPSRRPSAWPAGGDRCPRC